MVCCAPIPAISRASSAAWKLRRAGKIRLIGLSNIDRDGLDRALAVAPIASIQNRYNRAEREGDVLVDYTAAKGIAFIPYGPLGAHPMQSGAPLAQPGARARSGLPPAVAALRWLLDRSPNIVVIPGTTSFAHLEENRQA